MMVVLDPAAEGVAALDADAEAAGRVGEAPGVAPPEELAAALAAALGAALAVVPSTEVGEAAALGAPLPAALDAGAADAGAVVAVGEPAPQAARKAPTAEAETPSTAARR